MMEQNTFPPKYGLPRLYVGAWGAFLTLFAPFIFFLRDWIGTQNVLHAWPDWKFAVVSGILWIYGLACLLPYAWTRKGWPFKLRLGGVTAVGLYLLVSCALSMKRLLASGEMFDVATTAALMLLCVLTPVTMLMYKRIVAA